MAQRTLSPFKPHFAASAHAAELLASLWQDSARQRIDSRDFRAMDSRRW